MPTYPNTEFENSKDPGIQPMDVMCKSEVKVVIRYSNEPQVFLS